MCDPFWFLSVVGFDMNTHTQTYEKAGELRQNVQEGQTCQMCQVKLHS